MTIYTYEKTNWTRCPRLHAGQERARDPQPIDQHCLGEKVCFDPSFSEKCELKYRSFYEKSFFVRCHHLMSIMTTFDVL